MHTYYLTISVHQLSGHGLTRLSHKAVIMVSARVEVSSGCLTGEGSTSKLMWLLSGFISLKADRLKVSVLSWLFVRGCLQFFAV